ncbi:zinc-ribbon domain-containing protein [Clostridium sp. DJ247]|uniref:YfgJ family double zinc ribbon protein n=1 Tax=Clostridium sp. DJ247 TaxID=2726188 RepID=UPI0016252E41|nr:zinc-ribbon domain-containing protein [Clostridium sp. DJ247]MBC2581986.1 hypothetical protein [Clostridium sp. DJ247]
MEDLYYCPECNNELELIAGCGSASYFCNNCKKLISRKKILSYEEMKNKVVKVKDDDK